MSDEDSGVWHFANLLNQSQKVNVLGLSSARAFASMLSPGEITFWTVKQPELDYDVALHECKILFQKEGDTKSNKVHFKELASAAANQVISVVTEVDAVGRAQGGGGRERRKHKRVDARLKVMIIRGKEVFSVCTRNISEGGVLLENPIPQAFMNNFCKVHISTTDNSMSVNFEANILEASTRGSRLVFGGQLSEDNLKILRDWIATQEGEL